MNSYEAILKRKRDAESIRLTQERIAQEREQKAYAKGYAEGYAEGREIVKRAVAVKIKTMGIDYETISEVTGFSVEDIERL